MAGYEELSEVGLRMFIEDVIECHNVFVNTTKHNDDGCILEVDLEYPEAVHYAHNEYPLAPDSVKVGTVHKLILNLNNKTKYVVHFENLKMYESMGLKITKCDLYLLLYPIPSPYYIYNI